METAIRVSDDIVGAIIAGFAIAVGGDRLLSWRLYRSAKFALSEPPLVTLTVMV